MCVGVCFGEVYLNNKQRASVKTSQTISNYILEKVTTHKQVSAIIIFNTMFLYSHCVDIQSY